MSKGNADERAGGKPTYGKALDTWASVRIMNILDLSSIAVEGGNFSLGIDKINDAWEVLPNDIKAKFISPRSEIFNALRQVPTHDSLISDERFSDDEEIETWRYKFAANLIKSMIGDFKDRMVREMDSSGLYISQRKVKWGKRDYPTISGGNPDSRITTSE